MRDRRIQWFAVAALLTMASAAFAQDERPARELQPVQVGGAITGWRPGPGQNSALIEMTDAAKQPVLIKVDVGRTRVKLSGEALVEFLRPGMYVRFSGPLNRNTARQPVEELQLFLPTDGYEVGVMLDPSGDRNAPAVVAGQLKTLKSGKLTVAADGKQIKAELAPEVKITVEMSDFTLARPGDAIRVIGRQVEPGKVIGDEIEITLAEPLKALEDPKKKPRVSRAKKPAAVAEPTEETP
ncbi:MAG: hypothetical protein K1X74_21510 [Pirellulales bacterium]|nr:hypothetical protein [Pirellulales bacterium]